MINVLHSSVSRKRLTPEQIKDKQDIARRNLHPTQFMERISALDPRKGFSRAQLNISPARITMEFTESGISRSITSNSNSRDKAIGALMPALQRIAPNLHAATRLGVEAGVPGFEKYKVDGKIASAEFDVLGAWTRGDGQYVAFMEFGMRIMSAEDAKVPVNPAVAPVIGVSGCVIISTSKETDNAAQAVASMAQTLGYQNVSVAPASLEQGEQRRMSETQKLVGIIESTKREMGQQVAERDTKIAELKEQAQKDALTISELSSAVRALQASVDSREIILNTLIIKVKAAVERTFGTKNAVNAAKREAERKLSETTGKENTGAMRKYFADQKD